MASYEFFSDVDIKGNVLYNAVAHQAASNPAGKADGFWYYNTATHKFMFQQDGVFSDFGMASLQDDTNPILAGPLDTDGNQIRQSLGTNVASQSILPLPDNGNYYKITGNSDVEGIDAIYVGLEVELEFVSVLDLIHHPTSFILLTATDITTAAGDIARFREISTGNWKLTGYTRAAGTPLVGGGGFTNPMTTAGDLIIGGSAGAPQRLAKGTEGQTPRIVGGAITWADGGSSLLYERSFTISMGSDLHFVVIPRAGTIIGVEAEFAAAGTMDFEFDVKVNGSVQVNDLAVTSVASGGTRRYRNFASSVAVAAGDIIAINIGNDGSVTGSAAGSPATGPLRVGLRFQPS